MPIFLCLDRQSARDAVIELLPTPPLAEPNAIIFFIGILSNIFTYNTDNKWTILKKLKEKYLSLKLCLMQMHHCT